MADLTLLLDALHRGEPDAASALLAQVYAELRQLARAKMAREQPGQTLQPTALHFGRNTTRRRNRLRSASHFCSPPALSGANSFL